MSKPIIIAESNISIAWAKAFINAHDGHSEVPLIISIEGFEEELPPEDSLIRDELTRILNNWSDPQIPTINQTALTIVPYPRWIRENKPNIEMLTKWYLEQMLPRLKARCTKNRGGTYFERLVNYTGIKITGGVEESKVVNQIAHIVKCWKRSAEKGGRPRQSALQLACFDPIKDHTGQALKGFPCLQQISLTYTEAGTLEVNAFYPTQYIFDRAYGNYLGLCQLGHLIAHELSVKLTAFRCFTARPELGSGTKASHGDLKNFLLKRIEALEAVPENQVVSVC